MDSFVVLLGKPGLILVIGLMIFIYCYTHSVKIFDWIEVQTYGTRDYIMERLDILFIEMDPDRIAFVLLGVSFGLAAIVFGIFALFGLWTLAIIFSCIVGILGWKAPRPFVDSLVEKRIKAYQSQMVDGLNLLSNGLRAGLSLPQAFGMVVDELPAPISQEFNLVLQQNKIGVPFEECLETLNKRIPTEDNEMFVTSVNILRETGGNLPETFDTITEVVRERVRLQQKIDTYVSAGKAQAYIISAMPTGMLAITASSNPSAVVPLFTTGIGIVILVACIILNVGGFFVIMKIIKIKV